jgi:Galactose mutarotase and related enzymes
MKSIGFIWVIIVLASCSSTKKEQPSEPSDSTGHWVIYPPMSATIFSIANANGLKLKLTALGGKIMTLEVPDKNGVMADVVLGYDSAETYLTGNPYFGALIGRYGNRIAKGKFSLEGKNYQLGINNGENALHGGINGFHNVLWKVEPHSVENGEALKLTYQSKHMEEGYPGNLNVTVIYTLTNNNELVIDYEATTDQTTIINLTHHSFFNLAGEDQGDVSNHELYINADYFTPVDSELIPTGEIKSVKQTPLDFLTLQTIGGRIGAADEQIKFARGYDHNWVLNKKGNELSLAAKVVEPTSGRVMEVFTTEPALQFYSGNFLNGKDIGKGGKPYPYRSAFCLEAQHFPNSPNEPEFPSTVLKPGDIYRQKTIYRFSVLK